MQYSKERKEAALKKMMPPQAALLSQQRLQDEKVKRHYKNIIKRKVELVFKATSIGKIRGK